MTLGRKASMTLGRKASMTPSRKASPGQRRRASAALRRETPVTWVHKGTLVHWASNIRPMRGRRESVILTWQARAMAAADAPYAAAGTNGAALGSCIAAGHTVRAAWSRKRFPILPPDLLWRGQQGGGRGTESADGGDGGPFALIGPQRCGG